MAPTYPFAVPQPQPAYMFERGKCQGVRSETYITVFGDQTFCIDNPEIDLWLDEHAPGWQSSDDRLYIFIQDPDAAFYFKMRWC